MYILVIIIIAKKKNWPLLDSHFIHLLLVFFIQTNPEH